MVKRYGGHSQSTCHVVLQWGSLFLRFLIPSIFPARILQLNRIGIRGRVLHPRHISPKKRDDGQQ